MHGKPPSIQSRNNSVGSTSLELEEKGSFNNHSNQVPDSNLDPPDIDVIPEVSHSETDPDVPEQLQQPEGWGRTNYLKSYIQQYCTKILQVLGLSGLASAAAAAVYRTRLPFMNTSIQDATLSILPGTSSSYSYLYGSINNQAVFKYSPAEENSLPGYDLVLPQLQRVDNKTYNGLVAAMGTCGAIFFAYGNLKEEQIIATRRHEIAQRIKDEHFPDNGKKTPQYIINIVNFSGKLSTFLGKVAVFVSPMMGGYAYGTPTNEPIDGATSDPKYRYSFSSSVHNEYQSPPGSTTPYLLKHINYANFEFGEVQITKIFNDKLPAYAAGIMAISLPLDLFGEWLQDKAFGYKEGNLKFDATQLAAMHEAENIAASLINPSISRAIEASRTTGSAIHKSNSNSVNEAKYPNSDVEMGTISSQNHRFPEVITVIIATTEDRSRLSPSSQIAASRVSGNEEHQAAQAQPQQTAVQTMSSTTSLPPAQQTAVGGCGIM